jgi:chromosome segregation ATPase
LGGLEESRGEQAIALDHAQIIIRRLEAKVADGESSERRLTDVMAQLKARVIELEGRLGDSERSHASLTAKAAEFAECMTALAELHVQTSALWREAPQSRKQWLLALQDKISGRALKDQVAALQREHTRTEGHSSLPSFFSHHIVL